MGGPPKVTPFPLWHSGRPMTCVRPGGGSQVSGRKVPLLYQKKNTAKQLSCCLEKQNTSQSNIKPASEELVPVWGAAGVPGGWVGGWAPCLLAQLLALALMPAQPPRHAPGEGHCPEWGACGLLPSHPGRGFQGRGSAPVVGPRSLGTERRTVPLDPCGS